MSSSLKRMLIGALVAVGFAFVVLPQQPLLAFCSQEVEIFGINFHCVGEGHAEITRQGLSFMWRDLRNGAVYNNLIQDDGNAENDDRRHFDSCRFHEAVGYINDRHDAIVGFLDPANPDTPSAITAFGRLQHTIQDFYAHSNWFQLIGDTGGFDPSDLISSNTGHWADLLPLAPYRDDIMVGELPLRADGVPDRPPGYTVFERLDSDVPLILTPENKVFRALITGWNKPGRYPDPPDVDPDQGDGACVDGRPDNKVFDQYADDDGRTAKLTHGGGSDDRPCDDDFPTYVCLNRDEAGRPQHTRAMNSAVLQAQTEWCRMLHLTHDAYGNYEASSIPMGLWVEHDRPGVTPPDTPHPFGTACARDLSHAVKGPVGVTVALQSAEQLFSGSTPVVLGLVAYTGDFRESSRRWSDPIEFDGDPKSGIVTPRTMCVAAGDTYVVTLQGFIDLPFNSITPRLQIGEFDANFEPAIIGVTASFSSPAAAVGTHTRESAHLRASFNVSLETADNDNDGLADLCGELYYGTSAGNPDTDGDGLKDGEEANVYGTNPTIADTDGDGLNDATEVKGANPTNPLVADTDGDGLSDGTEDANHSGSRDATETDPNKPDTDADLLTDGCEIHGTNPTRPLVADTDGDGLLDGQEDKDHNCGLNAGETNPNDPDSDDDLLADGQEVTYGTDPLDPDSDNDGIPDGKDTEWLQNAINALPGSAFKDGNQGLKTALNSQLDGIERDVADGRIAKAVKSIDDLMKRVDGCGAVADNTDWIVDCGGQVQVRGFLSQLKAALGV